MSTCTREQETERDSSQKNLFKCAMKEDWNAVVKIYERDPNARKAKITRTGDTVLHVAVSVGNSDVVANLLAAIKQKEEVGVVLREKNEAGNTALHLAASLGMVGICEKLSRMEPDMIIKERNNKGETPLFAAANIGKKDVFLVLQAQIHDLIKTWPEGADVIGHCRRSSDGNTILHRAIHEEYFELAFEIMHAYPSLVDKRNARGETALHLMAAKPSAFKSGNRMSFLKGLLYRCVIIGPLTVKYSESESQNSSTQKEQQTNSELRESRGICLDIFSPIFKMVFNVLAINVRRQQTTKDGTNETNENQLDNNIESSRLEGGSQSHKKDADESIGKGSGIPPNYLRCFESLKTIMKSATGEGSQSTIKYAHESTAKGLPPNYLTCFYFPNAIVELFLIILGIAFGWPEKIERKKRKLEHANQIMRNLVERSSDWEYENDGTRPVLNDNEHDKLTSDLPNVRPEENVSSDQKDKDVNINANNRPSDDTNAKQPEKGPVKDTPILLAAKNGIVEIVKKISEDIPIAIQDVDSSHRNIVLLAALHRQPHIYQYMLGKKMRECLFGMVDKDGNTALHLAAKGSETHPWNIPGSALQMHWEIKWYKYVKNNAMGSNFFAPFNNNSESARDIFTESHKTLVKEGAEWLTNTSQSCSVVAALIATAAFASATTIPGGIKSDSGIPALEGQLSFNVFAMSSLVALCFSVTSLVMFLSILTSRYQAMDFETDLPLKLIIGLTSLFMSIASMMVTFCGAHFYLIANKLKYTVLPLYIVVCLPVTFFVKAQLPLYIDLMTATITHVPERTYKRRSL